MHCCAVLSPKRLPSRCNTHEPILHTDADANDGLGNTPLREQIATDNKYSLDVQNIYKSGFAFRPDLCKSGFAFRPDLGTCTTKIKNTK